MMRHAATTISGDGTNVAGADTRALSGGWLGSAGARRALLLTAAAVAGAAGSLATSGADAAAAEQAGGADLVRLLQMMALVKALLAAGAVWLMDWRLRAPVGPRMLAGYVAAAALLVAGPGLIWHLAWIIVGALAFHAGLALLLLLAWKDDGSGLALRGALGRMRVARAGSHGG